MIRRAIWLLVGAATGALVTVYTLAGIRQARTQLDPATVPARVARQAGRVAEGAGGARVRLREALEEGRRARRDYEARAHRPPPRRAGSGAASPAHRSRHGGETSGVGR